MRLDLFLKTSRMIVRRSQAQDFCDAGRIKVNGSKAKSSKEVRVGDEIEVRRRGRVTTIRVREVPTSKQVSKTSATELYEVLNETVTDEDSI